MLELGVHASPVQGLLRGKEGLKDFCGISYSGAGRGGLRRIGLEVSFKREGITNILLGIENWGIIVREYERLEL